MRSRLLIGGASLVLALVAVGVWVDVSPPGTRRSRGSDPRGGGVHTGGLPPAVYRGEYQSEVRYLLGRAPDWRASLDTRTDTGSPPGVALGSVCLRDGYVASAVQFAWAAESYYRLGVPAASEMAAAMRRDLDRADRLCGDALEAGARGCRTLHLWGCPPPW